MTDIVERLRQDGYTLDGDVADPLLEEAACEIERLREAWVDGKMKEDRDALAEKLVESERRREEQALHVQKWRIYVEDRCATAELRLKEAERKLAAIIALCSQEGCDGEPYDTFHAVATGEFDPHVRPADSASPTALCKTCGGTGREPVMIAGEWGVEWGSANCSVCKADQPGEAGK